MLYIEVSELLLCILLLRLLSGKKSEMCFFFFHSGVFCFNFSCIIINMPRFLFTKNNKIINIYASYLMIYVHLRNSSANLCQSNAELFYQLRCVCCRQGISACIRMSTFFFSFFLSFLKEQLCVLRMYDA